VQNKSDLTCPARSGKPEAERQRHEYMERKQMNNNAQVREVSKDEFDKFIDAYPQFLVTRSRPPFEFWLDLEDNKAEEECIKAWHKNVAPNKHRYFIGPFEMRCEGWRRNGGAFTFGPVKWEQCKNDAIVLLTVEQDGTVEELPACSACWQECLDNGIQINSSRPIPAMFFSNNKRGILTK